MKILLLGATGRTGRYVIEYALQKGYDIRCLARNSSRIPLREHIELQEGNPAKKEDLKQALQGCNVVINVLNISRINDFPWSPLKTPERYLSIVMTNIVNLSTQTSLFRVVSCSAWGVAETRNDIPFWFRWFIDNSNIGIAYKDHERQETLLKKSRLNWCIVRPVGLVNLKLNKKMITSINNRPKPGLFVSRRSLAYFLVKCVMDNTFLNQPVVVSA